MDDHPPNWGSNGSHCLREYGLTDNTVCRINPFLANSTRDPPPPIDPITFAKGLVENYSLTHVELYRCGVDSDGMAALAQALSVNKFIVYLGLSRNKFFTVGGIMLAESFKVNQTLQTVDLSWNELRNEFAVSLAEALTMNMSLQRIMLDKNKIGDDGLNALSSAVSTSRKLRYLGLSQNKLGAAGLSVLADAMKQNKSLQALDVSQNGASTEGCFSFFSALKTPNPTLLTLNLSYNRVGASILMLGRSISEGCSMLRELNLENCYLEQGAELTAFAQGLKNHQCLCTVSFANNEGLKDAGVTTLCEALTTVSPLRYVDFTETGITAACLDAVEWLVGPSCRVSTLHLSGNNFSGAESGEKLGHLLLNATQLEFFGASYCHLGVEATETLSHVLRHNRAHVTQFSLRSNNIGDAGFSHFLSFCLNHKHLEFLDLSNNDLTAFVRTRFVDIFHANPKLGYIAMNDKTLVDTENCYKPWEEVHNRTGPSQTTASPKNCAAPFDIPTTFAPSAGFAVYSLSIGSAMKRQLEGAKHAVEGMLPHAGKPCRGATIWTGVQRVATTKYRRKNPAAPDVESSASAIASYESNIGGLLVSDDQMRREFNRLDKNGNGYLDKEEFKAVYRSFENFGVEYSDHQLERMMKQYTQDDRLTFDEFCIMMLKLVNQ